MIIPVTRFKRPNGEQIDDSTNVADDCMDRYQEINSLGGRLTAEVLSTGHVSCCIEHPLWGDYDMSVTPNGPQVQAGIEKMLRRFNREQFAAWKATQEE